ncbi:hypothetical protein BT67DRAFT_441787 [Trichocladium antarcticum]|uniref:Uncharacterized protein n=1 Tax=Trichocladium antarcticum TaxID=1450529 RepID=A0AAN6UKK0_9PEZI|nr:hypothetical protein BT67DRAFT_441787 [Trichocladium antarcticum]
MFWDRRHVPALVTDSPESAPRTRPSTLLWQTMPAQYTAESQVRDWPKVGQLETTSITPNVNN